MRWFTLVWWQYLLEKPARGSSMFKAFFCRMLVHPAGVIYYNPIGLEPDMRCKNCGDEL